jgi:hypothetical protein
MANCEMAQHGFGFGFGFGVLSARGYNKGSKLLSVS